jgi:hypothetical protein
MDRGGFRGSRKNGTLRQRDTRWLAILGKRAVIVNEFKDCLKFSHSMSDLPLWKEVYRKAFPRMASMVDHRTDGWHQKAGVDRSIIMDDSKQVLIDEKVRGRNKITGIVYEDVSLEIVSNTKTRSPGWVCKPLLCEYIAYAIAPLGKCYLLPVIQLQAAWDHNHNKWVKMYREKQAINRGYCTTFVPVPVDELFRSMGQEFRISFEPFEYEEF